jgi:GTP cyclohydrolase I
VKFSLDESQKHKIQKLTGESLTPTKEKEILKAMEGIENIIELTGEDKNRDGLLETPFRVVKAFMEYTEGYKEDPKIHLRKTFEVYHNELVLVKDIEFFSLCEHHFAPFYGVAHVGYMPNGKVTGLSKIARLVEGYAKRFQVQERLGNQIVDAITDELNAEGAIVIINANHMCMCSRGIKKNASTITISSRGNINKNEVINLI